MPPRLAPLSYSPWSILTFANLLLVLCIAGEAVTILWMTGVIQKIINFYPDVRIPLLSRAFPDLTVPLILGFVVSSLIVVTPVLVFKAALQSGLRNNPSEWLGKGSNLFFFVLGAAVLCGICVVEITLLAESAKAGLAIEPCDPVLDPLRCTPLTPAEEAKRVENLNRQVVNAYRLGAMLSGINMAAGLVTAFVLNRISK